MGTPFLLGGVKPHIDDLAKKGTWFSRVCTPFPLTLPAHMPLFTPSPCLRKAARFGRDSQCRSTRPESMPSTPRAIRDRAGL